MLLARSHLIKKQNTSNYSKAIEQVFYIALYMTEKRFNGMVLNVVISLFIVVKKRLFLVG